MRAQTSSEYLIILTVVLIIGAITAALLGIIPVGGDTTTFRQNDLVAATKDVGIIAHAVSPSGTTVVLRNNLQDQILLKSLSVNGTQYSISTPYIMIAGNESVFTNTSVNLYTGEYYSFEVVITYNFQGTDYATSEVYIEGYAANS